MRNLKNSFESILQQREQNQIIYQPSFKFQTIFKQNDQIYQNSSNLLTNQLNLNNVMNKPQSKKESKDKQKQETYCQKYTDILINKYRKCQKKVENNHINVKLQPIKYYQPSGQDRILTGTLFVQKLFSTILHEFDIENEQQLQKVKNVRIKTTNKLNSIHNKSNQTMYQLELMQNFIISINRKFIKRLIPNFNQYKDQIKAHTPLKKLNKKELYQNGFENYQTLNKLTQLKDINNGRSISPLSPDLLSGCRSDHNRSNLLVSFKKNLDRSQHDCQTLKYSQSDFNFHVNDNDNDRSKAQKQKQKQKQKQDDQEIMFSHVQPYRLGRLEEQTKNVRRLEKNGQSENKLVELDFIQKDEEKIDNILKQFIKVNLIKCTKQLNYIKNIKVELSKAVQSFSEVYKKVELNIMQQKDMINREWKDQLQILSNQFEEMEKEIKQQRELNELKDKSFLNNLERVEKQLCGKIMMEKNQRRESEAMLAKMLGSIVESIEQKRL